LILSSSLTLLQKCQSAFSELFTTSCLLEIISLSWGCWFWHLPSLYDRSRVKGSPFLHVLILLTSGLYASWSLN